MRILSCISEDTYFLSHRKDLILGLQSAGIEVELITNLQERKQEALAVGVRIHPIDLDRKSLSPFSVLRGVLRYHRIIQHVRPDVLFAIALKPIIVASLCHYLGARQPILCAFTGLGVAFGGNSKSFGMRAARWGMERAFRPLLNYKRCYCLFQNRDDANLFWERGWTVAERSFVISGAGVTLADYDKKDWPDRGPVVFFFAGRLLWDKGIRELVEASRLLKDRGVHFKCQIAGLSDVTNETAVPIDFIKEQHRLGLIEWLGPRRDVPVLMRAADCFVFPSIYREGVPKVLLEASAAGLPMITTDMPGCRDVVKTGYNGLVVPPGDAVALAQAMEQCVVNRAQLPIWGANARRKAELEYGIEGVIERHVEIFRTIARRHKLPTRSTKLKPDQVKDHSPEELTNR